MAQQPKRLMSLDAYRGLVMLAMASGGFAFAQVTPKVRHEYDGTKWQNAWQFLWDTLAYQFDHVAWTGCSFWDLIQPSFMFMVGVSLPYSMARRIEEGDSPLRRFTHAVIRSLVLIVLGVLLISSLDNIQFSFVNVLTQIGLGYVFLFLLCGRSLKFLLFAATTVLVGYGVWFWQQPIDQAELQLTKQYIVEVKHLTSAEWSQFQGPAAHWNKHTNAAAQVDRDLLNHFPRPKSEELWNGRRFWINSGGYQTLNFIPSLATMIFGLMAGTVLRSGRDDGQRLRWLFRAGLACFVVSMAADTTIWPTQWLSPEWQDKFYEHSWSLCPAVKRIWTPTWAVFSAGWTFWILWAFYWFVDMKGHQRIMFPLAIVGINSIAMYAMAQLFRGWIGRALAVVANTVDQLAGWQVGLGTWLDPNRFVYAPIVDNALRLLVLWCVCLWLYRRRLFFRI